MGKRAVITVHPLYKIGEISQRLYGAFLEPIGTMVNGTMFQPHHPTADENGFRTDVIEALKDAELPAVRLPGGNFVSGWDWKDSIGPREQRKVHLDLAWHQIYTNDVGHDEYLKWAKLIGTEPMYTINLGSERNLNDAVYLTEYTNYSGGTYWSDLRRKYGQEDPYGVKLWYLGNEMDGPWQIGSWELDPGGYGIHANEISKAMKWVDGSIETAVCVSCSPLICHYPEWDMAVLEKCYDSVDYVSMHYYHNAPTNDFEALLGGSIYYEDYINTETAICDYLQTKCRSSKKMMLSFDEYGNMFGTQSKLNFGYSPKANLHRSFYQFNPDTKYVRHDPDNMGEGMMHGNQGDMIQALGNTSAQLAFLRHADRVKIGCMTGGIGALAASDHDHVWKSASYYPYSHLIRYGRGTSLKTIVDCETFDIEGYYMDDGNQFQKREGIPYLDTAAALNEEKKELTIFVIQRKWDAEMGVDIDVSGFSDWTFVEHIQMCSDDRDARSSFDHPDLIQPAVNRETRLEDGKIHATLKPLSWNVFRLEKKPMVQE